MRLPVVALALTSLCGCGYIGEPLYPALNIPVRIVDLAAIERGNKLEIRFTIPALTTEGLAVRSVGVIDLRVGPSPVGEFQTDRWAASAVPVTVSSPEKPQSMQAIGPIKGFVGKTVIVGVRIAGAKGRYSAWSNLVTVPIEPPLATPTNVLAEGVPEGVRVHWSGPEAAKFKVFRAPDGESKPTQLGTSDEPIYLDTTSEYGKTYIYYVQAIHNQAESDVAETQPLPTKDTFAPAVPAGLTASAGVTSIELAWERNTETDLKGYRIYRAVADGTFRVLANVDVPTYSDTKVEPGKRYRYQVTAFDQEANESSPSSEAAAGLP